MLTHESMIPKSMQTIHLPYYSNRIIRSFLIMIRSPLILTKQFIQTRTNPIARSHLFATSATNDTAITNKQLPVVEVSKFTNSKEHQDLLHPTKRAKEGEIKAACGDIKNNDDDDDAMEQEEMFVDAHSSFEHDKKEWGGPRRGGRLPEPTRYGDWERKGRCSDF